MKIILNVFIFMSLLACSKGDYSYECVGRSKTPDVEDVMSSGENLKRNVAEDNADLFISRYEDSHYCNCDVFV